MDNDTFDAVYELYWAAIYNSAYKRLGDTTKAIEITQEAFFQLWLDYKNHRSEKGIVLFLLKVVQIEVFKLLEKECIEIVNPPTMLFEGKILVGAN